jgi:hypothetical protein
MRFGDAWRQQAFVLEATHSWMREHQPEEVEEQGPELLRTIAEARRCAETSDKVAAMEGWLRTLDPAEANRLRERWTPIVKQEASSLVP